MVSEEGKAMEMVDILKYLGTYMAKGRVNTKSRERRLQDCMATCMAMVQQSERSGLRHPVVQCGIIKWLVLSYSCNSVTPQHTVLVLEGSM